MKAELAESLRTAGGETAAALKAIPAEVFSGGVYENGWTGKQVLAHVASIEWTYPRLIDLAAAAKADPSTADASGLDINAYNQRQVDTRADASVTDLIAEFEKNRAALISAVEAADDSLFGVSIISAGNIRGTLAEVLGYTGIKHVAEHVADIEKSAANR